MTSFKAFALHCVISSTLFAACPSYVRVLNGLLPHANPVVWSVGTSPLETLGFREASDYVAVEPGSVTVSAYASKGDPQALAMRQFRAASGKYYTVALSGPTPGQAGGPTLHGENPFVFLDDVTPPNSGRWKGRWYRMSETNVTIDLRVFDPKQPKTDKVRLRKKPNRASYDLPDSPVGTYSFNPVLIDTYDTLINSAFTPPKPVQVDSLTIESENLVDVFATGNSLGTAPDSLLLSFVRSKSEVAPDGCIEVRTLERGIR